MYPVWTLVQIKNPDHEYAGLAGRVHASDPVKHPESVVVELDGTADGAVSPGTRVEVAIADLAVRS